MVKKIRMQFILFNMIVISFVIFIFALYVYLGAKNSFPADRLVFTILFSLFLVFVASLSISKIMIIPIKKTWQNQLDFTSDASHELRTPLTIIKSSIEIIKDNEKSSIIDQMKWIDNIDIECNRMINLTNSLLMLSRADTNIQLLEKKIFDLSDIVKNIVEKFETLAVKKNMKINSDIDTDIKFYGDSEKIEQVLKILLDNAIKYNDEKTIIKVSLSKMRNKIILKVKDNGIGIKEDELPKIFDRFWRNLKTRQKNENGSGLGLSIAKWIIESHNAKINAESNFGKGTCFIISFDN